MTLKQLQDAIKHLPITTVLQFRSGKAGNQYNIHSVVIEQAFIGEKEQTYVVLVVNP